MAVKYYQIAYPKTSFSKNLKHGENKKTFTNSICVHGSWKADITQRCKPLEKNLEFSQTKEDYFSGAHQFYTMQKEFDESDLQY